VATGTDHNARDVAQISLVVGLTVKPTQCRLLPAAA